MKIVKFVAMLLMFIAFAAVVGGTLSPNPIHASSPSATPAPTIWPTPTDNVCQQGWRYGYLNGMEMCIKFLKQKLSGFSVKNLTTGESFQTIIIDSYPNLQITPIQQNGGLWGTTDWYVAAKTDKLPDLQKVTDFNFEGSVQFLVMYDGTTFVALRYSADNIFVPIPNFDVYQWPDGMTVIDVSPIDVGRNAIIGTMRGNRPDLNQPPATMKP